MTNQMTAISFRGDDVYLKAMKALAAVKDSTVGDLVFEAIKDSYGDELKPYLDLFRAKGGRKTDQSGRTVEQAEPVHRSHTNEDWAWVDPTTAETAATGKARNG